MVTLGFPIGLGVSIEYLATSTLTFIYAYKAAEALFGVQAAGVYNLVNALFSAGLGTAASVLVPRSLKANDKQHLKLGYAAISFSFLFSVVSCVLLHLFQKPFIDFLLDVRSSKQENDEEMAEAFLATQVWLQMFSNLRIGAIGALIGLSDTKFQMKVTIACIFMLNIATAAVEKFVFHQDPATLFRWQLLGAGIAMSALLTRWVLSDEKPSAESRAQRFCCCFFQPNRNDAEEAIDPPALDSSRSQVLVTARD